MDLFDTIKNWSTPSRIQVRVASKVEATEPDKAKKIAKAKLPVEASPYAKKKTVLTVEFCSSLAKENREKRIAKYPETAQFGQIQADLPSTVKNKPRTVKATKNL